MKNKIIGLFIFIFLNSFLGHSQITDFKEKFELPTIVKETSGLLFLNGKIITHNDSGDAANLYEIDSLTGNLLRTININNATNIDWEDISEDETHIYIGDFGNNNGDRTDLKIYKILKSDYVDNISISAEVILFSYEDQTDFTSKPNNNNFDAEALIIHESSIFIFSKNWTDLQTRVYKIPTTIGTYSAAKVSTANVEGLITGATIHNNNILLCGYDASAIPFLIYITSNRNTGDHLFNSGFDKHYLASELGQGNQVEAITSFDNGKFYISREAVSTAFLTLTPKLFEFKDDRTKTLSTEKNNIDILKISPNPTSNNINIKSSKSINSISIFNTLGKKVFAINFHQKEINISHLTKGIYMVRILFEDKKSVVRKVIKL
jgi:hypothetical protein